MFVVFFEVRPRTGQCSAYLGYAKDFVRQLAQLATAATCWA
jgi:hypothetical protein